MQRPSFYVRLLDDGSGYVIDAIWPGSETEQLPGVHKTPEDAERWVNQNSKAYVESNIAAHRNNVIPFRRPPDPVK